MDQLRARSLPALPEIFLLMMACVVLLVDLVAANAEAAAAYLLAQLTLLGCCLHHLFTVDGSRASTTFSNMFVDDLGRPAQAGDLSSRSIALVYARLPRDRGC
jgi:NADH-quinone oxidoreductase subunit N